MSAVIFDRRGRCLLLQKLTLLNVTLLMTFLIFMGNFAAAAAELKEGQALLLAGDYSNCVKIAREGLRERPGSEDWNLVLCQALMETGQYPQAQTAMSVALTQNPWSIRLRWQARDVYLSNGQTNKADQMTHEIVQFVGGNPRNYRDAPSLVAFGQAALLVGADPKLVLDTIYGTAKKADPNLRDVYIAGGELALDKHDFARAAEKFSEGLKQLPDDPDLNYGMARAYADSDRELMAESLEIALSHNTNHVASLLLLVDHSIDAEDYPQAVKYLDRIKSVNPWHPDAWAYRAVLAHLQNQPQAEQTARESALKYWPNNPRVDHLIGLKLSQKYRFTEGASHQRKALEFDPTYLPAKAQLAQDLLRLGNETEGWRLAENVQEQDGYDVEAYNLTTLHDQMRNFATLTNRNFLVRMSRHEASLYGPRVLDLLDRARSNLCAKYNFELKQNPTVVEVFPEQKDFAVRTFGMPGNPGYLGVCFGSVITANSPASQAAHPVNWEAVLWHEFCHVVTLQMTRNKMPRWLSEGISVYEERQANPAWGEHLNLDYRDMLLGDELTPISKLSGAFLMPPSPLHLQFAYYESSLVVEFIVQRYGLDQLKAILHDLGEGQEINQVIEKHTAPMEKLEKEFAAFARERAENLAPGLDWEKPEFAQAAGERGRRGTLDRLGERFSNTNAPPRGREPRTWSVDPLSTTNAPSHDTNAPPPSQVVLRGGGQADLWESWAQTHPTNFWVMTRQAIQLTQSRNWTQAKPVLQRLIALYPDFIGPESPYRMLAAAHRALGETNEERQVLSRYAEKDADATDVYLRLMELGVAAKDWAAVSLNAQRYLAVNPLVAPPYRFLAQASEHTDQAPAAITAYRGLLELGPADPADVHYRLADALHRTGNPEARRQVLMALEEAPRYQAALQLLLKINNESPQPKPAPGASKGTTME